MTSAKYIFTLISLLLCIVSANPLQACTRTPTKLSAHNDQKQKNAKTSPADNRIELAKTAKGKAAQIINHVGYTTSYNSSWLIPNWVAHELTAQEVAGTYPRPNKPFEPDPMVKGKTAYHRDYSNSGYSRGHMAPAADMKWSEQAMLESFFLNSGNKERLFPYKE